MRRFFIVVTCTLFAGYIIMIALTAGTYMFIASDKPINTVRQGSSSLLAYGADQVSTEDQTITNETFVGVRDYIPDIYVDLKYATEDNITGDVIYSFNEPYLRYGTLVKLKSAYEQVYEQGYSLKIWDAYRPVSAQFTLWEVMPNARYIANPNTGYSNHSRGNAVDVTLVTISGDEVTMPTGFDDFTTEADRDYTDLDPEVAELAEILEDTMINAGFEAYQAEWWHYSDSESYPVETSFQPPEGETENDLISVSAIGDNILATGYGFSYANSFEYYIDMGVGQDYFFQEVQSVLGSDDLTIGNSENVFTRATERVDKTDQGSNAFWFKSDPSYASIYTAGSVEAVNVANNHSHDYGEVGFEDSLEALENAGVETFGYGDIAYYEVRGTKIGMVGFNVLGPLEEGVDIEELKSDMEAEITEAKEVADIVIASFHWGIEKTTSSNEEQQELGHYAVDLGADLVLGHHPHRVQEIEVYKGVPIAYSLGNFVFGGNRYPAKDTIILTIEFNMEDGILRKVDYEALKTEVYGNTSLNNYQPILVE